MFNFQPPHIVKFLEVKYPTKIVNNPTNKKIWTPPFHIEFATVNWGGGGQSLKTTFGLRFPFELGISLVLYSPVFLTCLV